MVELKDISIGYQYSIEKKHLQGQHDQQSHGGNGNGELYVAAKHDDFVRSRSLLPKDKKYYVSQYSAKEMADHGLKAYLSKDKKSGYVIAPDGDLVNVFSLVDRGRELVLSAIAKGATKLDCFDGMLPKFYEGAGFKEYKREKNWTSGDPDVVYMRIERNK